MALSERITSVDRLRSWSDQLPLHYEYTAGVAGERFLRGLKEGKILVSKCLRCEKKYLPPRSYCIDCFVKIERYVEVGLTGKVSAITKSYVDFEGKRLEAPRTYAYVTFGTVTGGLIQVAGGGGIKVGSRVSPKFKPPSKRTGSMLDFEFSTT